MTYLDYAALMRTPVQANPFDHLIITDFIVPRRAAAVYADFPDVPGPGSYPPEGLGLKGHFEALMDELTGDAFRRAVESKFDIDLAGCPATYTVRAQTRDSDGAVHTDSKTKRLTVLLYMNETWQADGGRLRLLRTRDSLDDPVVEIPPLGGTLLVFRRSETSWHGHLPYRGQRRAVQLNWVISDAVAARERRRHRLSAAAKRLVRHLPFGGV